MRYRVPFFTFIFLAAIIVLRFQQLHDLHISMDLAWAGGLKSGFVFDLAITFIALGLGGLVFAAVPLLGRIALSFLFFAVWIVTVGNALHLKYFQSPLEIWTIRYHATDVSELGGSIESLGLSWWMIVSIGLFLVTLVGVWRMRPTEPVRWRRFVVALSWLVIGLIFKQTPVWMQWTATGEQHRGSFINTHPVLRMYKDLKQTGGMNAAYAGTGPVRLKPEDKEKTLSILRDFKNFNLPKDHSKAEILKTVTDHRTALGLAKDGPLKILLVYVESFRAFEFFHPELSQEIYPRIHQVFDKYGISFRQFYSSSALAGQTVRAQFSILCSIYPDVYGPATYIANPTIPIFCLPEALGSAGWSTTVMGTSESSFHNKALFDSQHGFQHLFYQKEFAARGLIQRVGPWGFADGPFLKEGLKIVGEDDKPNVFATFMMISSHHPFHTVAEGPLPARMKEWEKTHSEYAGYLSVFKYIDGAIAEFVDEVFKGPDSDRTLIVIVGDHGVPLGSAYEQSEIQEKESEFRIPMALLTKHMPKPREILAPAHQVDIAPTFAALAGIERPPYFLGRDLLSALSLEKGGSPWIYDEPIGLSYRSGESACYALKSVGGTRCFKIKKGQDPLFDRDLAPTDEIPQVSEVLRGVLRAVQQSLAAQILR